MATIKREKEKILNIQSYNNIETFYIEIIYRNFNFSIFWNIFEKSGFSKASLYQELFCDFFSAH